MPLSEVDGLISFDRYLDALAGVIDTRVTMGSLLLAYIAMIGALIMTGPNVLGFAGAPLLYWGLGAIALSPVVYVARCLMYWWCNASGKPQYFVSIIYAWPIVVFVTIQRIGLEELKGFGQCTRETRDAVLSKTIIGSDQNFWALWTFAFLTLAIYFAQKRLRGYYAVYAEQHGTR
jgi:hypothetical protein